MSLADDQILADITTARSTYSEDIASKILADAGLSPDELKKTISTGTGLVAYDLQAPAKNLYPVLTPIRNTIPRVPGGVGTATNWRQVNAIYGSGYDSTGWVPEGQRAGQMSYNTSNKSASYVTLGEEDAATFEAIGAGRGFEDVKARMIMRLMQKTMLKEEMAILAGNSSLQLGTPTAPTLSASGSGATLPGAPTTYSVIVVALTLEGYQNSSLTNGVATTMTITGADGKTFTLNGGSSNKSNATTQSVTLGQTLFASTPVVNGAVAYAWYVGTSGNETLQAISTINSVAFSVPLAGSRQAATVVTADCSTNSTGFDGLMTTSFKAGASGNAYVKALATGTSGTGTVLTASGRGSIVELDDMLQGMWDAYQATPSVFWANSRQIRDITTKCLTNASAPLLRYDHDPDKGEYNIVAGGTIAYYYNPFRQDGGTRIPIKIHPKVPPGTIIGWSDDLPVQYLSNEVPNAVEMKIRTDFYGIDWPLVTRQRQHGVYVEETLAVYAPFTTAILTNIAAG